MHVRVSQQQLTMCGHAKHFGSPKFVFLLCCVRSMSWVVMQMTWICHVEVSFVFFVADITLIEVETCSHDNESKQTEPKHGETVPFSKKALRQRLAWGSCRQHASLLFDSLSLLSVKHKEAHQILESCGTRTV